MDNLNQRNNFLAKVDLNQGSRIPILRVPNLHREKS